MNINLSQLIICITSLSFMCSCSNTPYEKMLRYRKSGIYDYKIFPARKLNASATPGFFVKDTVTGTEKLQHLQNSIGLNQLLEKNHTISFIVLRNDTIVAEKYFRNADSSFYAQYFSMTKSVISLLIGCAIDDKLIRSENDTITRYIPEFHTRGFKNITLRDLLNMTAPVKYTENDNPFGKHAKFYFTPHLEKDILNLEARENGQKKFVYRSCNTAILGLVLKRVLKTETITQYLQRKVWTPLGMENFGLWNIDHDSNGIERTWCCLSGTTRDFSKIALLYLTNGRCADKQIVSSEWIAKTLAPLNDSTDPVHYNFGWWFVPEQNAFIAIGKDGQFTYVSPANKIVIVRSGDKMGSMKREDWVKLFGQIADSF